MQWFWCWAILADKPNCIVSEPQCIQSKHVNYKHFQEVQGFRLKSGLHNVHHTALFTVTKRRLQNTQRIWVSMLCKVMVATSWKPVKFQFVPGSGCLSSSTRVPFLFSAGPYSKYFLRFGSPQNELGAFLPEFWFTWYLFKAFRILKINILNGWLAEFYCSWHISQGRR